MYSGNSVVVNFLMRWPVLIPAAVAAGVVAVIPKPVDLPVQPQPAVVEKVVPPVPRETAPPPLLSLTKKKKG